MMPNSWAQMIGQQQAPNQPNMPGGIQPPWGANPPRPVFPGMPNQPIGAQPMPGPVQGPMPGGPAQPIQGAPGGGQPGPVGPAQPVQGMPFQNPQVPPPNFLRRPVMGMMQ